MKNTVPLDKLQSGTYYSAPLWLDESYILLTEDAPVTEALTKCLKQWGYTAVQTNGTASGSSAAAGAAGAMLNNNAREIEGRQKARAFFAELAAFTRKAYDMFNRDGFLDLAAITEEVKKVILMIRDYRTYMLRLPDLKADGTDYLFTHSARSVIIALTVGDALKMPNFKLIELGIAALLHEIGMMKIPRQIFDKSTALTATEKKLIDTHPALGMKMLQDFSKENKKPIARDILLGIWQHHERANGSGYPEKLSGESITLFGKIIAVACSYDALISNRPFRSGNDGFTTMLTMLKEMRSLYDEKVISALITSISIYPLGSYVRLDNGSIGLVVDIGTNPRFPVVKLQLDSNLKNFKEQPVIKTAENDENGMFVASVLNQAEIDTLADRELIPR